jgi:hypothetical protein
MTERTPRLAQQSAERYDPPRYRNAEDLSGRQRAERRGGMTEAEFLATMQRGGFRMVTNDSPFFAFRHHVIGERDIAIRPGETFSRMADRAFATIAEMVIVKVQRPLNAGAHDLWLVYPRGKAWELLVPRATIPMSVRAVVDIEFKAYWHAKRIGDSRALNFGGQAHAQAW